MAGPLSDEQKIEQLWARLDVLHQENADLKLQLQLSSDELRRCQVDLSQARTLLHEAETSLIDACRQINASRAAAAAQAESLRSRLLHPQPTPDA
jgi:chromosome segregation ATPase